MEYVILYFSGTGNTALIADEIKKRLVNLNHTVDLVSIEDEEKLFNLDFTNKIIGFGFPVYKFSFPDIFGHLFSKLNQKINKNKYFMFSTYARFDAYAFSDFSKKLDKTKFHLISEQSFKSPSCGISARKPTDDYEYESVMFFEDGIKEKLDEFVNVVVLNSDKEEGIKQKHGLLSAIKKQIVKDVEITKYPKLQIKRDRCIRCGLCSKKCPEQNLIKGKDFIEIIDTSGCLHCLRCMNHCPSNAITFGELTGGDNQYTFKTRNMLFEKSASGFCEAYWGEFDTVIKKWQRKTIKYWWTHKNKKV